ncbi:MAG: cytochrome c [Gaiellaceae bacterium]|nr:cytochrome c [Gaiellaceae bacterium]
MRLAGILVGLSLLAFLVVGARNLTATDSDRSVRVAGGDAERGRGVIVDAGCGTCHTIPGIPSADGKVGPPLTDFAERSFVAGRLPNTSQNLIHWLREPQAVEPGTAMPDLGLSRQAATDAAAYLYTLGSRDRSDR